MPAPSTRPNEVAIELNAVLVALTADEPRVLTFEDGTLLPSGPFEADHPTLQTGLRAWVERPDAPSAGLCRAALDLRRPQPGRGGPAGAVMSISYLGLTRERYGRAREPAGRAGIAISPGRIGAAARPCWSATILPRLAQWIDEAGDPGRTRARQRVGRFRPRQRSWNEELVLQRYELLYEAGLVPEAGRPARPMPSVPGEPMSPTTAASSPPASRACAPRSNTVPSCSS